MSMDVEKELIKTNKAKAKIEKKKEERTIALTEEKALTKRVDELLSEIHSFEVEPEEIPSEIERNARIIKESWDEVFKTELVTEKDLAG